MAIITGTPGNDNLGTSRDPFDIIDGGAGDDLLFADFQRLNLTTGVTLLLDTTPGATSTASNGTTIKNIERIGTLGTAFDDTFGGGDGNDRLDGQGGNNRLDGGGGNDTLVSVTDGHDIIDGGVGKDLLIGDFRQLTTGLTLVLDTAPGATTMASNGTTIRNVEYVHITGTAFDDTLGGGAGDDMLVGSGGNNTLLGGAGNDTLVSSSGSVDAVDGGAGVDRWQAYFLPATSGITVVLDTTPGATTTVSNGTTLTNVEQITVGGGDAADTLSGGNEGDKLYGHGGDDRLHGGGGSDLLWGGAGNDILDGGAGDDRIYTHVIPERPTGEPPEIGIDVIDGGEGTDILTADFRLSTTGLTLVMNNTPGDTTTASNGTVIRSVESLNIITTDDADMISGTFGNDTIYAEGGDDVVFGSLGDDFIYGFAGDDVLLGGAGDDHLAADSGNDRLDGGDGDDWLGSGFDRDILSGGAGADQFGYDTFPSLIGIGATADTIVDFSQVQGDVIDLPYEVTTFVGDAAFSGAAGELRYEIEDFSTLVSGDVDGDATADFEIQLQGQISLTADDFML